MEQATKQQEREALAKIRKIIEGLGENSYIGTALYGALELAEQNIDMDAAFSTRYYIDEANGFEAYKRETRARDEENKRCISLLKAQIHEQNENLLELESALDIRDARYSALEQEATDNFATSHALRNENYRLKAKLYDYMTKEAE